MVACCSIYRSFLQIKIVQKLGSLLSKWLLLFMCTCVLCFGSLSRLGGVCVCAGFPTIQSMSADLLLRFSQAMTQQNHAHHAALFFCTSFICIVVSVWVCVWWSALSFVIFITLLTTQLFHDWLCIKNVFRPLIMLTVCCLMQHLLSLSLFCSSILLLCGHERAK